MDDASNSQSLENIQSLYQETADIETASDEYARRFDSEIGAYFLDVQTKTTLAFLRNKPKARVLDVGGGHAQVAVPLVQQGYDVTVVGSSEVCRRRLDLILKQGSFQYHSCNMLSLPFENESYDVVLAFRLLPHVNEWRRLLAEMCRVAKNDVIVDYPDVISFNVIANQFFKTKKAIEGNTRPYRCFRRSELLKEFAEHRFTQSAIRPEFFIPMVIHRALGSVKISKTIEFFSNMLGMRRLFGSPVILRVSRANHGC